ncbi:serine/threonine protein kinase [Arthrobacter sp. NicSoilB4]|uniref:serine/threonine-protein kinase n=1 Tax=Arthrobacter sp. NicSoilB4 TaxID=2830997 RepID=UPI001CC59F6E|nr:serine/threonine-protein kinase [Arthrobacter sp. NicSoilB4]BCW66304.1 serine/threonine protein kinase [Arthrobacter sp. NicSoilB4]
MSSKRPVAPPPIIPGFTYISLLGSGGFSDVYLYEQDRPRRKVAVKVLLSDLKTEGARRRFESEANLMAQLSSHPYIVTIFEAEITDAGHSYLAMEYCSRPSLDVRYRRQRFSVDEVLAVGIQVASAIETAHRAGIAHRDIKPANILVTDYNRPALTDFGISGTLAGDADEDAGMSIPWSPPEQFTGRQVDGVLVDVWALGATLYTLLAGRSPFVLPGADNSQRELISRITNLPVPGLGRADVPESLELALSTAMAKSASSRYSSAHAFALALQRIQAELNLSVTPFEVLEEPRAEENHPDDGFEETRVRSVASIDPDATGNAPTFPARFPAGDTGTTADNATTYNNATIQRPPAVPGFDTPGPGTAAGPAADDDLAATVNRSSAAARDRDSRDGAGSADDGAGEHLADHGRRNLLLSVVGGTVLVAAVVLGIVAGTTRPEPAPKATDQVSKPPADALDNGTVPDVTGLAGVAGPAGKVSFTWTNPQPKPGDSYKWRVHTLKGDGQYQATAGPAAEMAANPAEPSCIQVMIVRSDGASSPLGPDSIACVPK